MKSLKVLTVCLVLLCTGCSNTNSTEQTFENSVTEACKLVQIGFNLETQEVEIRNEYWKEAARIFRNISDQNLKFPDYAEGLNAWASGFASSKIYEVFKFCETS